MKSDKTQLASGTSTRQKVIAGVIVLVIIIILWQVYGAFRGGASSPAPIAPVNQIATSTPPEMHPTQQMVPQPAQINKQPMSQRELELMQLQQQTEAKYLSALNELQMLKLSQQIAETNQAIMSAKLQTVTAEKKIVDLLKPEPPPSYAQGLVAPTTVTTIRPVQPVQPEVNYVVISVTELQGRWSAVLGYQGNLFSVNTGDVLPADGSKVVRINRSGVILEKNGVAKRVSLVPII